MPAELGGTWFDPSSRPERDRPSWGDPEPAPDGQAGQPAPDWATPAPGPGWAAPPDPAGWAAADPPASSWSTPVPEPTPGWSTPEPAPGWGADPTQTRADLTSLGGDGFTQTRADLTSLGGDGFTQTRADLTSLGSDAARRTPPPAPTDTPPRGEQASSSWAGVTRGGTPAGVSLPARPAAPPGTGSPPWLTMPVAIVTGNGLPGDTGPASASPFAGARPAGFSAPGAAQSALAGTPRPFRGADTGNFRRQGQDTGAFRRIRDTGAMRAIMDTGAMRSLMDTAAFQALRDRYAGKGRVIATIVIACWVVLAVVGAVLAFGLHGAGNSATASSEPTTGVTAHPAATPTAKSGAPARTLPVAKVIAWGPTGPGSAEHPEQVARVIDASATTAWHSKWYRQPTFPGVGLVFDMGKTVTVTSLKLRLAPGDASFLIRLGNKAVPGTLTKVAARTQSGGDVTVKLAKPSRGRYVEIWFTLLPKDSTGTYQESVYSVQVTGLV